MRQKVYTNLNSAGKALEQTHFPRNYDSTYTFVTLLFILRYFASISPAP